MATLHVGETATVKNNQVFFFFFPYVSFFLYTVYLLLRFLNDYKIGELFRKNFDEKLCTVPAKRFYEFISMILS